MVVAIVLIIVLSEVFLVMRAAAAQKQDPEIEEYELLEQDAYLQAWQKKREGNT